MQTGSLIVASETRIFGIRHHGPGSARSLRAALEAWEPDCILVEGPPDAASVLPLLAHAEMKPPVALLIYMPEEPARSVYYPFAVYSPEWQAIEYGIRSSVPVRFMDLPREHQFAIEAEEERRQAETALAEEPAASEARLPGSAEESPTEQQSAESALSPQDETATSPAATEAARARADAAPAGTEAASPQNHAPPAGANSMPTEVEMPSAEPESLPEEAENMPASIRRDPLNWIAEAAGYSDGETWWEHMVEQRRGDVEVFQAVMEMMTALREAAPLEITPLEARREAWMRQTLRAAQKEGFQRIAVVCGAWHGPALATLPSAKDDALLLKSLPKSRVTATWVPWTYGRLTYASGYGAGVVSPAWYEHLWHWPDCIAPRWMISVAALFREEDLPASPASVIEAVRLADALAAVRDRPIPGLPELWEAAQSVFCFGSDLPMRLIQERLVVGERLGQVPEATPMLPIQQDIRGLQKRLRMAPDAAYSDKDLDLRNPTDMDRSRLLHRLNVLEVPWGDLQRTGGKKGTFHEVWRLQWMPEFEVKLIEANVYGNTVHGAASRRVRETADKIEALPELTALVERALLADLPEVMAYLMARMENLSALTSDVPHLMDSLPPLAGVLRYGNVRQTDATMVGHAVDGLTARICIGLPSACASLNDEAAAEMYDRIVAVDSAFRLLQNEVHLAAWDAAMQALADMHGIHGLIDGRCCRLLFDRGIYTADEIERRMNLALSPAGDPARAAAWIDGLLRDSGDLLVHTDSLWPILDRWVAGLEAELFPQLLPLVRRTFSGFPPALRRQLGQRARGGSSVRAAGRQGPSQIDEERAALVLPLLGRILGLHA